jgi:ubiquitin carboxyl-terminal hydrolase 4/11
MRDQAQVDQTNASASEPLATFRYATAPEKLRAVEQARQSPMDIGSTWYIVSWPWYRRWTKACAGEVDKDGRVEEDDIGPIDNSHLVDQDGELITTIEEGVNVTFVPSWIWDLFIQW